MRIPLRNYRIFALIMLGLGLILTGVAAYALILRTPESSYTDSPTDFSAIPVKIDRLAPLLTLNDIQGERHSLSDFRGQVVLVNLWATWCPPCKAEMPNLQAFYDRHHSEGFTVIAVEDGDPTNDVLAFVWQYGLSFPVWLDPTYQATDHVFKTVNLPSSYVIDRGGVIRLQWVGAISEQNLENYITPLIQE